MPRGGCWLLVLVGPLYGKGCEDCRQPCLSRRLGFLGRFGEPRARRPEHHFPRDFANIGAAAAPLAGVLRASHSTSIGHALRQWQASVPTGTELSHNMHYGNKYIVYFQSIETFSGKFSGQPIAQNETTVAFRSRRYAEYLVADERLSAQLWLTPISNAFCGGNTPETINSLTCVTASAFNAPKELDTIPSKDLILPIFPCVIFRNVA